jgi:AI-2 transport protein TqsA
MAGAEQGRSEARVQTNCLLTLTVIAVGVALYLLRPVLVPFALALFLTCCLTPLVDWQVRHLRLHRLPATVLATALGLTVLVLFGFVVVAEVGSIVQNFGAYQARLEALTDRVAAQVPLDALGVKHSAQTGLEIVIPESTRRWFFSAAFSGGLDFISTGGLVVIFMIFLLLGRAARRGPPSELLAAIEARVTRYVLQIVGLSLLTGVLVGGSLAVLGVEFAFVFGFLAFLLNFIPTVGSIVATLLPLPVVLLSSDLSLTAQVLALAVPAAIQAVLGAFVQPRVQGEAMELHPVVVLMALIFFGMIWGIVGAILAVPTTAVIKMLLEHYPTTRPLAGLLAGKLTPFLRDPGAAPADGVKTDSPAGSPQTGAGPPGR